MGKRIFLAGATGAVGKRLLPLLLGAGHHVVGSTRSSARAEALSSVGVEPVVVDVFDSYALCKVVAEARPEIIIHQLTDLPLGLPPVLMGEAQKANARIREEGTRNLVRAAHSAGSRRFIAQSIAWAYAPGPQPFTESSPLHVGPAAELSVSKRGIIALEESVLNASPIQGLVLRYGLLYGPGTGVDTPPASLPLHVDAAAYAAFLAIGNGRSGILNIVEPNSQVATDNAVIDLGWDPAFRLPNGI